MAEQFKHKTLDEWKKLCESSYHVRPGESVIYTEQSDGVIHAGVSDTAILLGCYFTEERKSDRVAAGFCWYHQ
jgi:hypothetical protein